MTFFYASVDQQPLLIENRRFVGGITIICQPTYGRFLFTSHDAIVRNNIFVGEGITLR